MFKKILSIALSLIMVIGFSSQVFADSQDMEYKLKDVELAKTRAEIFLKNVGRTSQLKDEVLLENLNGEYEAVAFTLGEKGYIIVNLKDMTIPELSFENPNPYLNIENPVYNGTLGYYSKKGNEFVSLKDNVSVGMEQFNKVYSKEEISNKKELVQGLEDSSKEQLRHVNIERYINGSLKTWYISGGHCGSIACAICMRYYDDYVSTKYVASNQTDEDSLISLMQQYVGAGGTSTSDLVDGLNEYFDDRNVYNTTYSKSYFSFNTIKNKINKSRPVIIDTDSHPTYGEHWIIAHGYFASKVDGDYVIVNDGWGSNNVWLNIDSGDLDDLVYFKR